MWPFGKSTQARVEEALKEQAQLKGLKLSVDVKKNVAYITGDVPSEGHKSLVTSVASTINGIKSVDVSGVKVAAQSAPASAATSAPAPTVSAPASSTGSAPAAASEDPSAKAKAAYAKIRAEASLSNNPLDVLQKGSTIVLRGAVDTEAEFNKAKELAASVAGVTGVDTSGLQVIQNASQLNETDDDGDIVYTVKSGDTLSHIALHYYGDAGRKWYMKIAEANGIADANKIYVGQQLKIPGTTAGPEQVA
ncbi:MAG: BON domain-containing protein [Trueperaceae bacterium]|nr:BON domain-containing protein [Trueperaceae bacterium]